MYQFILLSFSFNQLQKNDEIIYNQYKYLRVILDYKLKNIKFYLKIN